MGPEVGQQCRVQNLLQLQLRAGHQHRLDDPDRCVPQRGAGQRLVGVDTVQQDGEGEDGFRRRGDAQGRDESR